MINFWEAFDSFKDDFKNKHLVLFLDYDGTLAPIAEVPDKALLPENIQKVLIELAGLPTCHLAVISGRTLTDLKTMINIPNITYVGNHGFEIDHSSLMNLISTQYREDLMTIKQVLQNKLAAIEGVWLEDKGIILTLHFRLAGERGEFLARKILVDVCHDYLHARRVNIIEGKKVLEIRPPIKWDKGEAALWLLNKWQRQFGKENILAIYIGDDTTDEDAFRMINGIALTIKVGKTTGSSAHYYLNDQSDVFNLLAQFLLHIKSINR